MGRLRITLNEQYRLVDHLLAVRSLRDRRIRDLVVTNLEDDLGRDLAIIRHDMDRADMLSIVSACVRHPGALHLLAMIVDFFEAGSTASANLRSVVDRLDPETLLASDERAELDELLSGISCPDAEHFYWVAVGQFGPPPTTGTRDLVNLARDLEDMVAVEGVPPLLVFVELLAWRTPSRSAALRQWVDRYAARDGIEPRRISRVRASAPERCGERQPNSYLMVQLEPYGPNPDRYLLSAWFQRGQQAKALRRDEEPLDIDDVPREINHLLTRDAEVTRDRSALLMVEMILPRRLINSDVDQWPISPADFARPMGTQHPVVVRTLERLHDPALHREWRRKWEWLKQHGDDVEARSAAVHWIRTPGEVDSQRLMIQLIAGATPVFVGMAFPPSPDTGLGYDEFAAGIHAGAPVMLWCRDRRAADAFECEIRELLDGESLMRLPELVQRYRQRAYFPDQPANHLGRHLTLLWDDADRVPDDFDNLLVPAKGAR